jgi:hypothetical protein
LSDSFYSTDGDDEFWGSLGHEETPGEEAAPEAETEPAVEAEAEPEPVAEAEPEAEADEQEEPAAERPRDEKGRFTKAQEDDLQAKIEALEKRVADRENTLGRQSEELGELRKLREQMSALETQVSRPQVSDWDSLIDNDPARAARIALDAGDGYRYQQAREAWNDLSPGAPDLFEHNLRLEKQLNDLSAEMKQGLAPIAERQQVETTARAYERALKEFPDFDQHEDTMQQIVDENPVLKDALELAVKSGDQDKQYQALSTIYQLASGRATDTLTAERQKVAASLAEETLQAKQDAVVVSATSAPPEPVKPATWWDVAEADEKRRADGWNIS